MNTTLIVATLFLALSLLFFLLAVRDRLRRGAEISPARKAWLRVGLAFLATCFYLYWLALKG